MKFNSIIVCETCISDSRSNNISLINLLEEIGFTGFPLIIPKATVVVKIEKEESDDDTISMEVKAKINENEIFNQPVKADFKGKAKTRVILELNGLPIKESGILKFVSTYNDEDVLEYPINIKEPEGPEIEIR